MSASMEMPTLSVSEDEIAAAIERLDLLEEEERAEAPTGKLEGLFKPMDRDQVKAAIQAEITDAVDAQQGQLAISRQTAMDYYLGRPFGNEQEGRSKVVLTDVADTIEWIMPALMNMFFASEEIVRYSPETERDEEFVDLATDYMNNLFLNELDGFNLCLEGFKTALLEKNHVFKVYREERFEPKETSYYAITEDQVVDLLSDDETEIIAMSESEKEGLAVAPPAPPQPGPNGEPPPPEALEPQLVPIKLYDVTVRRKEKSCHFVVEGIPPEQFVMSRRSMRLDDRTPFSAHRMRLTVSDLIALGFDPELIAQIPEGNAMEFDATRVNRYADEEPSLNESTRSDPAARELWVTECYIRIDEDGDGYAELRKITVGGDGDGLGDCVILDDVKVNANPFSYLAPIPMPFKFFGLSIADLMSDLQIIRSMLLRNMLDNIYLTNNARVAVVEGQVEIDDLLTSVPGGVVRMTAPGMVEPLNVQPLGPMAMNALEYLDRQGEARSGVSKYYQGSDSGGLNQTARGITAIMNAAQARVVLIARIFSFQLRRLFQQLLRLSIESPDQKRTVKLRGKWVEVDPTAWNSNMKCRVQVGLGIGQAAERIENLQGIIALQEKAQMAGFGGYLVTPKNFYSAAKMLSSAMGFNADEQFFTNPEGKEPPPPKPDPAMVMAEAEMAKVKAQAQREQAELALEKAKVEAELQLKREELDQKGQLEIMKIQSDEKIALAKIAMERHKIQTIQVDRVEEGAGA